MGDRARAVSLYHQAQQIKDGGNADGAALQQAYQFVASSVMVDPTLALGWFELGNANAENQWRDAAVAAYKKALELPDGTVSGDMTPEWRVKCMANLAHNLHHLGRNDEAEKVASQAIIMDDKTANAWLSLSMIQNVQGRLGNAVMSATKAFSMDQSPVIEMGLAFAHMYSGNYAEGLKHFEARFPYVLRQFLTYPYPQWKGEKGKTVFLISDQGMGDVLSFMRFVPALIEQSAMVHIRVQPPLVKLLKIMLQRYSNVTIEPAPCPFPPADCWTTFMSLPVALGLTTEEIVYAKALPAPDFQTAPTWKDPDAKFHIGVTWTGSNANWINNHRSFPIEVLLDLYRVKGIQLYSLQADNGQQGEPSMEIHQKGAAALIRDMRPYMTDVTETMAILKHMDLVITCESLLGHICGLMEKEAWIPYSYAGGDFRIGRTEDGALWYPNHRIFKQKPDMRWDSVFERIIAELKLRVESHGKQSRVA